MSEKMKKHIEKRYREILQFLTEHDADVIRTQVDQSYHDGQKTGQKNQAFLDYLPLSFIVFCTVLFILFAFVLTSIINATWRDYVASLVASHQVEIESLEHSNKLKQDGSNESQRVCIEKLIECELTKTK